MRTELKVTFFDLNIWVRFVCPESTVVSSTSPEVVSSKISKAKIITEQPYVPHDSVESAMDTGYSVIVAPSQSSSSTPSGQSATQGGRFTGWKRYILPPEYLFNRTNISLG